MSYLDALFGLSEKLTVITGGGGVLAGAMTEALLKAGADVSLWGRGGESLETAYNKLSSSTGLKNNIHTVIVDTASEKQVREALLVDENTGGLTERGRTVSERTPFERFGDTKELAGAVLFLASSKASGFVTGITIPIDGGFLADNI
jgi:NAD(P)-dependent dehydrogenase (short-subunit alcohol dehydrogenase family)